TGDTQQQNHGEVPQTRPSHCQNAFARGANPETSSANSVASQIVRRILTALLWRNPDAIAGAGSCSGPPGPPMLGGACGSIDGATGPPRAPRRTLPPALGG